MSGYRWEIFPCEDGGVDFVFEDYRHGQDVGIRIDADGAAWLVEFIDGAGTIERTRIDSLSAFLVKWCETYDKAN